MKKILNKHSKTSKIIALWLVFVMLATPFFAHAGFSRDTKADGINAAIQVVENTSVQLSKLDLSEVKFADSEIGSAAGGIQPKDKVYDYYNIDAFKVSAPPATNPASYTKTLDDGSSLNITSLATKYKVYDSSISDTITDETVLTDAEVNVSNNKSLVAYVKRVGTKTNTDSSSCAYESDYEKLCTYTFRSLEPFTGNFSVKFEDEDGAAIDSSKYYKKFKLNISNTDTVQSYLDGTGIGVIECGVSKNNDTPAIWKKVGTDGKCDIDLETLDALADFEGAVKVYLRYAVPDGNGSYTTAKMVSVPCNVSTDRKEPVIDSATGLYYKASGAHDATYTDSDKVTEDVPVREDCRIRYKYYFIGEDAGSGIDKVELYKGTAKIKEFTQDSTNNCYYLYIDNDMIYPETDTEDITIKVYDKMGNVATSNAVAKLLQVDNTRKEVKLTWGDMNSAGTVISVGGITTPVIDNKPKQIGYEITSYARPTKVSLKDIVNNITVSEMPYNLSDSDQYYKLTGTFTIPASTAINTKYENLAVIVEYEGTDSTQTQVIGTFGYDKTAPRFVFAGTTDRYGISGYWNIDDIGSFDVISGEGDYESDIVEASYTIGDTKYDLTVSNGKVTNASINLLHITKSVNIYGTPIVLYAKDVAGNEFTETEYYKKDITPPVMGELKLIRRSGSSIMELGTIVNDEATLNFKVTDNIGLQKAELRVKQSDGTYNDSADSKIEYDPGVMAITLDDTGFSMSDLPKDRDLTVKVTLYDIAGNTADKEISFYLDCTPPTCDVDTDAVLQVKNGADWEDVADIAGDEVYYIDADKEYRCKVIVKDEKKLSDTNPAVITAIDGYAGNPVNNVQAADTGNTDTQQTYYISIDNTKVPLAGSAVVADAGSLKFKLMDFAYNISDVYSLKKPLRLMDKSLRIEAELYTVDGDVKVDAADLPKLLEGTNKEYYVLVHLSSGKKLDADSVKLVEGGASVYDSARSMVKSNLDNPDSAGRYNIYIKYILPTDTNLLFEGIEATGKELEAPFDEKTVNLNDILYDKTTPTLMKAGTGIEFNPTREWVKEISEDIDIKSGDSTIIESKLVEAWYSVNGTKSADFTISADGKSGNGNIAVNESSLTTAGTTVRVYAKDKAGNVTDKEYTVWVDNIKPEITGVSVSGNANISEMSNPVGGAPVIKATVKDNLTIKDVRMQVTFPGETSAAYTKTIEVNANVNGAQKDISYTIEKLSSQQALPDGRYTVKVIVTDMAGNSEEMSKTFIVDNTKPVITAQINSGTVSSKNAYYYKSDVGVMLTYSDANIDSSAVRVTDNGKAVALNWSAHADSEGRYVAYYNTGDEGAHTVKITAVDKAGNEGVPSVVTFNIDKTVPVLSTLLNGGMVYTDSTGMLYMNGNVNLSVGVSDTNEDIADLNYQVIYTRPDGEKITNLYKKTSDRNFTFAEEGEYEINLFAIDKATNYSRTRSVFFRIDKNAPVLSINGVGQGTYTSNLSVSMNMKEAFWRDASGVITIYRKPGDGQQETLYKTIDVTPTSADMSVTENITEEGVYRIEFTAEDRTGHTSQTSVEFILDKSAPEVKLTGPDNYYKTKDEVSISFSITDIFYLGKKIDIKGTRTDDAGKVHQLDFGNYNEAASTTAISATFKEDGVYDISITVTDQAGNSDSRELHFTIDKTAPQVGDLSYLDGKTINSFNWKEDLDELVSDLTVCDVKMYLNGSEYDGKSDIEDGSYTLLITATDELGNVTEKEVKFVLDTKAPVFIVTGVEENEVKNEDYNINVSLQLAEDTLTSVTLNGKEMTISGNSCAFTVKDKGTYKLVMTATDEAGNIATYELEFKYGQESAWYIWVIIAGVIVAVGILIVVIAKKNKKDK